ncbi:hypothetical protein BZG36_03425 [Bifiguratus adelaidae]|uniref:Alpha/beta hydrolase fold-3 domain-containing protein n=1 Tax=Bifiguratus adelaidae TaxID=1938954 RepID=A0A261XZ33_9FUNG|nr:hypothetical protein BZG36_03425 [Bifiguratus adelaidae]
MSSLSFEPAVQKFIDTTNKAKPIYELTPQEARNNLISLQAKQSDADFDVEDTKIENISVRITRPKGSNNILPVIFYCHGAGWVMGNKHTHDRLVKDLVQKTGAAAVFVDYDLSPEAKYPIAINQFYTILKWTAERGRDKKLDGSRIVIAGDSVGGNMAAVLAIMCKKDNGPKILGQVMFYPVVDANFETGSYNQFAQGYFLTKKAMEWFWDQYLPDKAKRNEIYASPLNASVQDLAGLPPALIITGEADVLRDGGESYAHKLIQAGVDVTAIRCLGIVHDFMMLDLFEGYESSKGVHHYCRHHDQGIVGYSLKTQAMGSTREKIAPGVL